MVDYSKLTKKELIEKLVAFEANEKGKAEKNSSLNINEPDPGLNLKNSLRLSESLLRAAKAIPSRKTFYDAAHSVFQELKQLIGATAGYIALLNKDTGMNDVVYLDPGDQLCTVDPNLPMPVRGFRAEVYQSKEVKYNNDFKNSDWVKLMPKGHTILHNVMFVPMLIDDKAIGLIGLSNKAGGFTDEDAEMAKEFGLLAVIALNYSNSLEENTEYQNKIKESEEMYRSMIEDSPVMIWESGTDTRCIFFNKRWLEFRGRAMDEETGEGWTEGLHPDDFDDCVNSYLNAFEKREKFEIEYRLRNKDGMYRWILDIGTPQFHSDGVFKGYIGSCIDITEQKQFEQIQKEKEEFYHALFEKNKAVKLLIDPVTGKIEDANTAAFEFYGYSLPELRSMKIMDINQLTDKQVQHEMQKALHEKRQFFEFKHQLANGEVRDVAVYSGPVYYKKRELLYSIIYDITEKKKSETALKESEEKYRNLYLNTPVMLHSIDAEGKLVSVSDYWLKKLGYERHEVIGRKSLEFLTSESQEKFYKYFPVFKEKGEIFDMQYQMVKKNGKIIDVLLSAISEKNKDGSLKRTLAVIVDITDRIKAEKEKSIILETMSEMLTYYDKDLNIIWANKASRSYRNIGNRNIEGFKCYEVFENRDTPCPKCPVIKSIKSKRPEECEIKTSDEKYFQLRSYPVINAKNEIEGVVEFTIDITEQKQKDEELKRIYNLYRTLTSNLPGINVYLFDDEKRIILAEGSEFKERIYLKSDFVGRMVTELDLDKKMLDYLDHLFNTALKGEKVSNELKYKGWWYQHIAVPVKDHKNKVLGGIVVAQNITEQKRASIELEHSKEKLKHLSHHLQQLIEKEKSHIAREIHDDLGQNLTIIKLNLALLQKSLQLDEINNLKMKNIFEVVDETIQKMKKMSTALRPGLIDNLGLIPAIEWYVNDFQKQTGVLCNFKYNKENIVVNKDLAINIFRIIQESLTNVLKHANAKKVDIMVSEKNRKIMLKIKDDGKGIKPENMNKTNSFGILGMQERTELFNGKIDIYSEKGNGTMIKVEFPKK
ncbi:MAG: PAS domain S-box protein [Bacteroidales bacterium]